MNKCFRWPPSSLLMFQHPGPDLEDKNCQVLRPWQEPSNLNTTLLHLPQPFAHNSHFHGFSLKLNRLANFKKILTPPYQIIFLIFEKKQKKWRSLRPGYKSGQFVKTSGLAVRNVACTILERRKKINTHCKNAKKKILRTNYINFTVKTTPVTPK